MKLVDTNVLLHAINTRSPDHQAAKGWLDRALSGGAPVGFAWLALVAFIRLATHPAIFERPLTAAQAMGQVQAWLAAPTAAVLHPGKDHPQTLARMLAAAGGAGNLTNDAHLAALAAEHKATLVSFDSDFSRFPGLRWERPA
ncbi:PIN domain-containing protein [Nocardioides sp. Y6]|uniref:Ribonuclease VapC n=1 Tax=Nocardioides malaquae TaxID=2773426 RepID=A0ABR9RWD9_9ACTN|nr:TA system VapC family ribonuclease toxin [Nocardioides malaquae]MBE7325899.1 PIN domain-containing protein [Nocardioides malaquae]